MGPDKDKIDCKIDKWFGNHIQKFGDDAESDKTGGEADKNKKKEDVYKNKD